MIEKLIILDRDGVINFDSPDFIKSPAEWQPIPGSLEAIAALHKAGYKIAIASNQSGIARNLFSLETLAKIHQKLYDHLANLGAKCDAIFFCPHGPDDGCNCRKPKPGLMQQAENYFGLDFSKVVVPAIGDSLRDLEAAKSAGCKPILVLTGNGQKTLKNLPENLKNVDVFDDLWQASTSLLKQ